MNSIVKPRNFNVKELKHSDPKVNNYGGKMVYLNYGGEKQSIILQTPKMRMPYDMSQFKQDNAPADADAKYSISLAFNNMESDEKIKTLFDKLTSLDKRLINLGIKNSQKWFKAKHNKEVIKALYSPIIKYYKDKETGEISDKFAPTIKLKLPRSKDKKFVCQVFNDKREQVELESVVGKGALVQTLMKCSSIWFAGGKFGVSWRVEQMKVTPSKRLQGYAFEDSDDECDDVEEVTAIEDSSSDESSSDTDSDSDSD